MEADIFSFSFTAKEAIEQMLIGALIGGLAVMLGVLIFGRNYKKRIANLERRGRVVINVGSPDNSKREILDALESKSKRDEADKAAVYSLQEIKEAAASLPQHRFEGTNHTYAELPVGTNIVTMEDGSIRLAMPVQVAATVAAGGASVVSAGVTKVRDEDDS